MRDASIPIFPIIFLFVLGVLFFGFVIYFSISEDIHEKRTEYKMPNGAICQDLSYNGFGGTNEFSNCDDDKTYLNPESWEEIDKRVVVLQEGEKK